MSKSKNKIKVGITMGDPSGIGPAIVFKAVRELRGLADFVIIGDAWVLDKVAKTQGRLGASVKLIDMNNVNHDNFKFGKIRAEYGRASMEYLQRALELIKKNEIDCLVTSPISKESINLAGYHYSGHTEFLADYFHVKDLVMLLLNRDLKISLVTRHIPLKMVPGAVDKNRICMNVNLTVRSLKEMFSVNKPKIIVCGLNPHASDNGLLGLEENKIINPAVEILRKKLKAKIDGPVSADVAIHKAAVGEYDCVIAMYHDQALIPLKLFANDTGVNMTLGLPFVRTSPLHGTAFDIAAKFKHANPCSLIEAILSAVKCTKNQKKD